MLKKFWKRLTYRPTWSYKVINTATIHYSFAPDYPKSNNEAEASEYTTVYVYTDAWQNKRGPYDSDYSNQWRATKSPVRENNHDIEIIQFGVKIRTNHFKWYKITYKYTAEVACDGVRQEKYTDFNAIQNS
jgi:hypothetical protein